MRTSLALNLTTIQARARFYIVWLVAAHVPIITLVAQQMGALSPAIFVATALMGGASLMVHYTRQHASLVNNTLAVALMVQVMLLVACLKGHPWQIDMHMYFFAAVGILACLIDWVAIVFATIAVALHHLLLDLFIPAYVFPGSETDIARVVLHAVILLLESGALIVICLLIKSAFAASEKAQQTAHEALVRVRESVAEQERNAEAAREERRLFIAKIASEFETSVKGIAQGVTRASTELSEVATSMVKTVATSTDLSASASTAAGEMSNNVQSVSASANELSASVREISEQLQKTNHLVQQSTTKTRNADKLAQVLTTATNKVSEVMGMISGIASQINLLALNATIESARAGEAGRGFAVVASEVKNLAGQTDRSIEEIKNVVTEMRGAAADITQALAEIDHSVADISSASTTVAAAVEEQSATTNEIARTMQNAARGTQTISGNLQRVNESSTQTSTSANQMLGAATNLTQQAEVLREHVDSFLQKIKGA